MYSLLIVIIVLVVVAFLPSLMYLRSIRNTEIFNREPWYLVRRAFLWGAFISVILAIIFSLVLLEVFNQALTREYEWVMMDDRFSVLIGACIVAPFAEEFAKGLGVYVRRKNLTELENGFVYGAAVGLGFAATENLMYEGSALFTAGVGAFIVTAIMRSLLSALLHGSSTSVMGYGIARKMLLGKSVVPFYLLAVAMHAFFNFSVSMAVLFTGDLAVVSALVGLLIVIIYVPTTYHLIKKKIRELDSAYAVRYYQQSQIDQPWKRM